MLEIHKPVYSMSFRTITAKAFRLYTDTLKNVSTKVYKTYLQKKQVLLVKYITLV